MPDFDKVHDRLPGPYLKPYKQLCEGQSSEAIARGLGKALIRSLRYHGREPMDFILRLASRENNPWQLRKLKDPESRLLILDKIEEEATTDISSKRAAALATRACRLALSDSSQSESNGRQRALLAYIREVFSNSFLSKLQLTAQHDSGIPHEVIEERIQEVLPFLESTIMPSLARQIQSAGGAVERLQLPSWKSSAKVDLSINLNRI